MTSGFSSPTPGSAPEKPEFKLTRSAPQQESSSTGLILLLLAICLGGGGYLLFRQEAPAEGDPQEQGQPKAQPSEAPPEETVPDWVWERLDFMEGENVERALDFAEEQLEATPNAELKERIKGYRKELGFDEVPRSVAQLLIVAQQEMTANNFEAARDLAERVLEEDPEEAKAYFIRGFCHGRLGDRLSSQNDLEQALELGFQPASKVEGLLEQLRR